MLHRINRCRTTICHRRFISHRRLFFHLWIRFSCHILTDYYYTAKLTNLPVPAKEKSSFLLPKSIQVFGYSVKRKRMEYIKKISIIIFINNIIIGLKLHGLPPIETTEYLNTRIPPPAPKQGLTTFVCKRFRVRIKTSKSFS